MFDFIRNLFKKKKDQVLLLKTNKARKKLEYFKTNELPKIETELITKKEEDSTEYLKTELEKGTYVLLSTTNKEGDKYYLTLKPKDINTINSPTADQISEDNFIFRITLNYDKETCDKKVNSKYGTVENIEFGNKSTIEGGEKVPYKSEEVVKILASPRCLTKHSCGAHAYSTIILENFDYFKKQKNGENLDFIFPIISNDEKEIESKRYIMNHLLNKKHKTIFVPFIMDHHIALARLDYDSKKNRIGFIDSSRFFSCNIIDGELLECYGLENLHKFLKHKGEMLYLPYSINHKHLQPQIDLFPVAYDTKGKCESTFLSGTCIYHTLGVSNKIIKLLSQKSTKKKLIKRNNSMIRLYLQAQLYQESVNRAKETLEQYLIPIHNSTKKQLEQIFDNFEVKEEDNKKYIENNILGEKSLYNKIESQYITYNTNAIATGIFVNKETKDILIIEQPKIKNAQISETIIMGEQVINGKDTYITKSALFGYGRVLNSTINKTKTLYSNIVNSTLENSAIKSSYLSNVKSYGARIKDSDISNYSEKSCIILGDDNVNLSNINLNIDSDIKDDIIITTHDFLEKLKNAKEDKQYTEYFNFLKKHNIEIDELKSYDVNNNGVIILSNCRNLDLEVNQNNNSIEIKNKPNNLSNTQSVNNLDDKCKDTLSTMSVISTDIQTNKSSSKGIINTMSTDTSSTLSPLSIETPRINEDKNAAKRGCCTCTTM